MEFLFGPVPTGSVQRKSGEKTERDAVKRALRQRIDRALAQRPTRATFSHQLADDRVTVIFNEAGGRTTGVSYIYQEHRFKGSDLGKRYAWKGIDRQLAPAETKTAGETLQRRERKAAIEDVKKSLRACIDDALDQVLTLEAFSQLLSLHGVAVTIEKGRSGGKAISYQYEDHRFKGADLGKKYALRSVKRVFAPDITRKTTPLPQLNQWTKQRMNSLKRVLKKVATRKITPLPRLDLWTRQRMNSLKRVLKKIATRKTTPLLRARKTKKAGWLIRVRDRWRNHRQLKKQHRNTLQDALEHRIDRALAQQLTRKAFAKQLANAGVKVIFKRNLLGKIKGVRYRFRKHWFNSENLGYDYDWESIEYKLSPERITAPVYRPDRPQTPQVRHFSAYEPTYERPSRTRMLGASLMSTGKALMPDKPKDEEEAEAEKEQRPKRKRSRGYYGP